MSKSALAVTGAAAGLVLLASPSIPQDPAYHRMADVRTWSGIPNALNVLSNLPFAVIGLLGLHATFDRRTVSALADPWERWPFAALFAGVALTALGSSYYHLAPDNHRLVWDRLPMTMGFMGLMAGVIAERVALATAKALFVPLLLAGVGSVLYWYGTETAGRGDLRPYILVQFGSLAAVLALVLAKRRHLRSTGDILLGLAGYAAAKLLEAADRPIFALGGGLVSGHTLKHLVAAGSVVFLVSMLRDRGTAGLVRRASA